MAEPKEANESIELMDMTKNATYSLPVSVWFWIRDEARRRNTTASGLIVELVSQEQKAVAA